MKFNRANTKIEKMAKLLISEYFPDLKKIKILYVTRAKPKPGEDGTVVAGTARILPAKLQDIWGYHAEIELAWPIWEAMQPSQKRRLLWHELRHLQVELDENKEPVTDKDGRISCHCDDHDVHIRTFSDELKIFGLEKSDLKVLKTLYTIYKKYKAGKVKVIKPFTHDGVEVEF